MTMVAGQQTAVGSRATLAFPGMLSDVTFQKDVVSYVNDEASAEIPFGVMVAQGTTDKAGLLCTIAAGLAGILVHSHAYAKDTELGDTGLKPNVTLGLLRHGRIWVKIEETVAVGDAVRVRMVAGGGETAGAFRTTADSTDCTDISMVAHWVTGGTAAVGFAELEINLTTGGVVTVNPD